MKYVLSTVLAILCSSCVDEGQHETALDNADVNRVWGGEIVTSANDSEWSNAVADLDGCTGLLIAPRLILTARHCGMMPNASFRYFDQSGNMQVETIPMVEIIRAPIFDGFSGNADIKIFLLQYPPAGVKPYWNPISDTDNSVGDQVLEVLGYGTGDGSTPGDTLRRGYNCTVTKDVLRFTYEWDYDNFDFWGVYWDCSEPEDWTVGEGGDSGASVFNQDGKMVALHVRSPEPENWGPYLAWTDSNGKRPYIDWINSVISRYTVLPSTYLLLM